MDCPILQRLLDLEIPVQLDKRGYRVEGFYKHGSVLLRRIDPDPEDDSLYQVDGRYGNLGEVSSWDDLVLLNFGEWQRFQSSLGWDHPDSRWAPEMERMGLVKVKTETVYTAV